MKEASSKKEKTKIKNRTQQGITLIALVVTIVVLLILAGITINMLFSNGGIFKTAEDAADAWNKAVTNEQASLDNIADQIDNLVNGTGEDTEIPDVLERYILGEDKTGVLATDIFDTNTMKFKDNDIIPDASTSLTFLGMDTVGDKIQITFQYNNETYIGIGSSSTYMTEELIKKATETTGKWDGTTNDKVTAVQSKDATPVNVPVPKGFTASTVEAEQKVEEGFVIKQDGTNNEFVWIPVNNTQLEIMYNTENPGTPLSTYEGVDATTDVYSKLRGTNGASTGGAPGSTTYREPDILIDTTYGDAVIGNSSRGIEQIKTVFGFKEEDGNILDQFADMLVADYEASYASIKKYGGFYIGRYELTGSTASPTVQAGQTVLASQNWYNLYKACSGIVNTASANAKSTMINGTQWNRVLEWLVETGMDSKKVYEDSSTWGNYSNYNTANGYTEGTPGYEEAAGTGVQPAGSSEYWKANNVYDLAGNAWEWTQEANDTLGRVLRGGVYSLSGSDRPASYRGYTDPSYSSSYDSARPALYVGL